MVLCSISRVSVYARLITHVFAVLKMYVKSHAQRLTQAKNRNVLGELYETAHCKELILRGEIVSAVAFNYVIFGVMRYLKKNVIQYLFFLLTKRNYM